MANFVIIQIIKDDDLGKKIHELFHNKSMMIADSDNWLISYEGTSRQLSDYLEITDSGTESGIGSALVLNFTGYWGRATNDIWEWLSENTNV